MIRLSKLVGILLLILVIPQRPNEETQSFEEVKSLLRNKIETLSKIITAECGICRESEKYLVGSAVLNRVASKYRPNTIEGVIKQEGQFDGYESRHYENRDSVVALNLLMFGYKRNYEVLYFYQPNASDTVFVNSMSSRVLIKEKYHYFAK